MNLGDRRGKSGIDLMRIVDLFCGIGGVAEASRDLADTVCVPARLDALPRIFPEVVAAIDIDRRIVPVYKKNHRVKPTVQAIESIQQVPDADLWWMSPPCQPYSRRGKGRAEDDPRSMALSRVIELVERDQPKGLILENVPGFSDSAHHQILTDALRAANYSVCVDELCPTMWKVPMRRRRFYLRARRGGAPIAPVKTELLGRPLSECVDESSWDDPSLLVSESEQATYARAMNIVDASDAAAVAACFTSAYGNSPVQAGSYLRCSRRQAIRRFSPQEIGRLMGYREGFWWPDAMDQRVRYQLLGNALSVTVVRALLMTML